MPKPPLCLSTLMMPLALALTLTAPASAHADEPPPYDRVGAFHLELALFPTILVQ